MEVLAFRSKVYFVSANVPVDYIPKVPPTKWYTHSLVYQTKELAGKILEDIISPGDTVAIKIHFGERYTQCYIRPVYVRKIVEKVKEMGGKPFVCDTLFSGGKVLHDEGGEALWSRRDLEEGLKTAAMNGFTPETMDCPVIFADAPKGLKSVEFDVNGRFIKKVYIAPAIAEADVLLSVAHFKCHDVMSVGGALKNIGVGCQSKQGKWWIHHNTKLEVDWEKCNGCGKCIPACPTNAIVLSEGKAKIIPEKCIDCAFCIDYCPTEAFISRIFPDVLEQESRIGEAAAGIIKYFRGKCACINLAIDIVPLCDCDPFVGIPIVPNLGVFASKDPVAVDRACIDMVNNSPGIPGSMAEAAGVMERGAEKFNAIARLRWKATPGAAHVAPDWRVMLEAAEKAGAGKQDYELIEINFGYSPRNSGNKP
ncbi:MAG: DUF362 domain-containing protein [Candidatus Bathyarchaeota archaeon]|nr:DUF362 domain-containing protein [Candidatus Bathyarchaeota archaeon]